MSASKDRLYDVLHEHAISSTTFPTPDDLEEVASALGGLDEFLIAPIRAAVAKDAVADGEFSHEVIGRLVVWADHIRMLADSIDAAVIEISVIARERMDSGSELPLTAGFVSDRDQFERMKQRLSYV
jgi:hypothetical protein